MKDKEIFISYEISSAVKNTKEYFLVRAKKENNKKNQQSFRLFLCCVVCFFVSLLHGHQQC